MRYDNIITLTEMVPEKYFSIKIPKLTLQPLVENSIYHGLRVKEGKKGNIEIAICEAEGKICLTVTDDGMGMSGEELANYQPEYFGQQLRGRVRDFQYQQAD